MLDSQQVLDLMEIGQTSELQKTPSFHVNSFINGERSNLGNKSERMRTFAFIRVIYSVI
jgi:hypothetical protein